MPRFWNVLHVRIYRKRNGRHNKKSNMADDPYLDCTVGQEDSAVMKENPLYFITNIQEDDDTHVWTDRNLFANAKKSDLDIIALVPVYLFFTWMLCFYVKSRVDIDIILRMLKTRDCDHVCGLHNVWQLMPPVLSFIDVFSHKYSHLVPKRSTL